MEQPLDEIINHLWRTANMAPTERPQQTAPECPRTLPPGSRYELTRYETGEAWMGILIIPREDRVLSCTDRDESACLAKLRALYLEANCG